MIAFLRWIFKNSALFNSLNYKLINDLNLVIVQIKVISEIN
jgi:hypothetical protein